MSERDDWGILKRLLSEAAIPHLKLHGHVMQAVGWPDVVIAYSGHSIWLELKSGKGKLSAIQAEKIRRLRSRRVPAFCLRNLTILEGPDGELEWRLLPVDANVHAWLNVILRAHELSGGIGV